jgi:hypothetical protein
VFGHWFPLSRRRQQKKKKGPGVPKGLTGLIASGRQRRRRLPVL